MPGKKHLSLIHRRFAENNFGDNPNRCLELEDNKRCRRPVVEPTHYCEFHIEKRKKIIDMKCSVKGCGLPVWIYCLGNTLLCEEHYGIRIRKVCEHLQRLNHSVSYRDQINAISAYTGLT